MSKRIALFNNQGGNVRLPFYAGIAAELREISPALEPIVVVWSSSEVDDAKRLGAGEVIAYDDWFWQCPAFNDAELDRLAESYPEVDWSEVIATERSFTDYSALLGSSGDRKETLTYTTQLLHRIVCFFEHLIIDKQIEVIVCPTADTLFTLVGFKVAAQYRIPIISETAAWLMPREMSGAGFFTSDEFMRCDRMQIEYTKLCDRALSGTEISMANEMAQTILDFRGKTDFSEKNKGKKAGFSAVSPNIVHAFKYLIENHRLDKRITYTKFEPWEKIWANLTRVFRKFTNKRRLGKSDVRMVPERSVFFALQYQPEQSTLTQANWYTNQIYVIECISRSLPPGYTLVVKEHPWGRGNRPAWQYKHVNRLYNVMMCDAPAKEIIKKVKVVVALPGTVAIESLVMGCPTVLLGRAFFDYTRLLHKIDYIQQLPRVLKSILIDRKISQQNVFESEIARFLLAYRAGLIPAYPLAENAKIYAKEVIREISMRSNESICNLDSRVLGESAAEIADKR